MNINSHPKSFASRGGATGKEWSQYAVIGVVVLASAVVSYWGSQLLFILALAVVGGVGVLLLLLRQINLGYIFLLLAGMFVPFSGPGGVNASAIMVALILFLWALNDIAVKRRFQTIRSRTFLPAVIFIGVSFVAFGVGQVPWFRFAQQAPLDAQIGGLAIFVLSLGLMLSVAHLMQDRKWLEIIVWVFLIFGSILVFGRALGLPVDRFYQGGYTSQSMFWTWMAAMLASRLLFDNKLKWQARGFLAISLAATFYVAMVIQNDWKSGWVPPALAVMVLVGLRFRKLVPYLAPFALIAVIYLAQDLILTDQYSWDTRAEARRIVLEISRISPIFGLGFANYYWYTPLFPILGYYIQFNSHSQYVDIIAQTGLLGLICYFWLFFEIGRLAWKLMNRLPEGFEKSYAYGVFAGLIGCLLASYLVDWLLPFVYNIGFNGFRASILPWLFFGGLIAIEQVYLARDVKEARRV